MSKVKGQGQRGDEYAVAVLKGPCPLPPREFGIHGAVLVCLTSQRSICAIKAATHTSELVEN